MATGPEDRGFGRDQESVMRSHRFALAVLLALTLAAVLAAPTTAAQVRFRVTISPSPMAIGAVPVNQQSSFQVIYATNHSAMPLRWVHSVFSPRGGSSDVIIDSGATLSAPCWNGTALIVQPGQTCGLVPVAFKPFSTGSFYVDIVSTFTDGATIFGVTSTAKGKGV